MCAIEYYDYEDYKQWDGKWELIYGMPMAMSPSPMISHQAIAYEIAFELKSNIKECSNCLILGEEDWKISNDTVVRPDVVLICDEPSQEYITKAPIIIAEVVSKSTAKRDEKTKYELYEKEGVLYYCIVYPDDLKAKIFKLIDGKYKKMGDFSKETFLFEDIECPTSIDFKNVFEKFRK
jgi:Uma2 family endonuclease